MWRKSLYALLVAFVVGPLVGLAPARALTVSPVKYEFEVAAGDTVTGSVRLVNEGSATETFYMEALDFKSADNSGTPAFLDAGTSSRSMASWIKFSQSSVVLQPGGFANVNFTVSVPTTASPGGYYAGVLAGTSAPSTTGNAVGAVAKVGSLLIVTVAGPVVEKATLTGFTSSAASGASLPVDFSATLQNSGTVHLKPAGVIRITNMWGGTSAVIPVNEDGGNVLPDSSRTFTASWSKADLDEDASELAKEWKNFGFGPYTATLIMNYGDANQVVSATTSFWVMPWMMVVLFIILLVVAALLVVQYNKWVVSQAMSKRR